MARPKGTGNKPMKRLLAERLSEKYPDFDPILSMIESSLEIQRQAQVSNEIADHRAAIEALDRTAKYIQPTLKATEISTGAGLTISVNRKRYDGSQSNDV
jgi:hypothetical protein